MILINGIYVTLDDDTIGFEPERELTPEERGIVIEMTVYNDIYHYKTIYD
jgi:hypothetical protein